MLEQYFYARCKQINCGKVFEGNLSWSGPISDVDIFDKEGKSPLIDLLQQHHLETNQVLQHNSFALFTDEQQALNVVETAVNPLRTFSRFPEATGYISVSRQRNLTFILRKDPTITTSK